MVIRPHRSGLRAQVGKQRPERTRRLLCCACMCLQRALAHAARWHMRRAGTYGALARAVQAVDVHKRGRGTHVVSIRADLLETT